MLALLFVCLVLFGLWVASSTISRQAEAAYGPAAPGLSFRQRKVLEVILLLNKDQLLEPFDLPGEEQQFTVQSGESTPLIMGRLWEAGLIPDPAALRSFLQYSGLDTGLQAGDYLLNSGLSPVELAYALQDATPKSVTMRILPGWRLEEIAASLPTTGLNISPETFLIAAAQAPSGHPLAQYLPDGRSLEGFLYPDVYEFPREAEVEALITRSLDRFLELLSPELLAGIERQGLSLYEAVTLASVVEREAILDEEKPLIASVFLNRLAAGIKLDADPTVQYAAGYDPDRGGWWPMPITRTDLERLSPYNTYLAAGLPPGPIANPSIDSLKAVAFPAQTPYYYFQAECDQSGRHAFAETFQQHLENSCP
jgi:UPF0755 protein